MSPGHVGHRDPAIVGGIDLSQVEHPEVRLERRERVLGDLRRGRRQGGEQRGLPGVRQTDEADIRDEPQVQPDTALLARLPLLGMARCAMGCRGEVDVAEAVLAAPRHEHALAGPDEVRQQVTGCVVVDGGARRDRQDQVRARLPVAARTRTAAAGVGPEMVVEPVLAERGLAGIDDEVDGATPAAIATVRTAPGDVGLAPERGRPVAAVAGAQPDRGPVKKHGLSTRE